MRKHTYRFCVCVTFGAVCIPNGAETVRKSFVMLNIAFEFIVFDRYNAKMGKNAFDGNVHGYGNAKMSGQPKFRPASKSFIIRSCWRFCYPLTHFRVLVFVNILAITPYTQRACVCVCDR